MSKQNKEFKMSLLTAKIVSLLCLISGGLGFFIGVFKVIGNTSRIFNIQTLVHFALCGVSFFTIVFSIPYLIVFLQGYFDIKSKIKYREYIKFTLSSNTMSSLNLKFILYINLLMRFYLR